MKDKMLITMLLLILLSPVVEIIIEKSSPVLGGDDVSLLFAENSKNYFFYNCHSDDCIKTFLESGDMPEECYSDNNEKFENLLEFRNRPYKASLDKNFQKFLFSGISLINSLYILGDLALNGNLQGHCYFEGELTRDGYNITARHSTVDDELFYTTDEYKELRLKSNPRSIASNFMYDIDGSIIERYIPDAAMNYKIGGNRDNDHMIDYQMLLGWLIFADGWAGGQSLQLFEDDCTVYKVDWVSEFPTMMYRTGLPAEQIRKDYAEFFRVSLKRMEYFESVLNDNEVEHDIFYLSYYPYYGKLWVIAKIPEEQLQAGSMLIDGSEYEYELIYPFIFIDVNDLDDGKHIFEIRAVDGSYSIDFYVSGADIFVDKNQWVISDGELKLSFFNFYPQDVIITKITADDPQKNIHCGYDGETTLSPKVTMYEESDGYTYHNTTSINIPCSGLSPYEDWTVDLDMRIIWHMANETADMEREINGEIIGRVQ